GTSRPRYKAHRSVDDEHGVIVATATTAGDVGENRMFRPLLLQGERNVGSLPESVVADSQYGTAENFRDATAMGVKPHMHPTAGRPSELFGSERFAYDKASDTYACPKGKKLYPKSSDKTRYGIEYAVRKGTCQECSLREKCTKSESGRTVLRRWGQELVDEGMAEVDTQEGKTARRRRKWLMEGSFAQGANLHGLKRSRWRRLWRQGIQDHLIAAVQNMKILVSAAGKD
ncbi:transposase, partial [Pelagicoccus mobilis]